MKIKKAVLPVAGVGTRFLPATKTVPKELLPIVDKPVIQYLVEEAVQSGIEEIIFVISKGKEAIIEHFSDHPPLMELLQKRNKVEILEKVEPIHKLAKFSHVYQDEPMGDGHAILQAEKLVGNEPFLVLFGDDIVKNEIPAAKQLIDHYKGESIIAAQEIDKADAGSYGMINPASQDEYLYEVKGLVEKPLPEDAPSNLGVIGKYVCPPEIFDAIREGSHGADGELRLIDGFIKLQEKQKVWAYAVQGQRFDTGKPEGLVAANQAYLKNC